MVRRFRSIWLAGVVLAAGLAAAPGAQVAEGAHHHCHGSASGLSSRRAHYQFSCDYPVTGYDVKANRELAKVRDDGGYQCQRVGPKHFVCGVAHSTIPSQSDGVARVANPPLCPAPPGKHLKLKIVAHLDINPPPETRYRFKLNGPC